MKLIKLTKPQIGNFYLLTYSKVETPWLPAEKILFVQDEETFIKINTTEGAEYNSRWDWATENAVTILKLMENEALVEKLNRSIELGRIIEKAELRK